MYTKREFIVALELLAGECGIYGHDNVAKGFGSAGAAFCHPRCGTRFVAALWLGVGSREETNQRIAALCGCEPAE